MHFGVLVFYRQWGRTSLAWFVTLG